MTAWMTAGASSIGKSHIDSALPNQDSLFFYHNEQFSVAVVCDGAGSAAMSAQGSHYFAQAVGSFLVNTVQSADNSGFEKDWLNEARIVSELGAIRQSLVKQIPAEYALKDYHSTVTAVLVLPMLHQALMMQIGDSPMIASQFSITGSHIDYFHGLQFYGEEGKDEYVNETHFITQDNWQQHLRIAWLDLQQVDMLAVMSDGCGDLVMEGGKLPKTIYRPFFGNLLFNLLQAQDETMANQLIQTTLDNPATYRLTGDDKTLVVLYREQTKQYQPLEPVIETVTQTTLSTNAQMPSMPTSQSVWQSADNLSNSIPQTPDQPEHAVSLDNASRIDTKFPEYHRDQSALPPIQKNPLTTVDSTALPEPVAVPTKKNKTALITSLVAIASVVGLIGLNKDKIFNQFSTTSAISSPQANSAATNTPISAPTVTASDTIDAVNTELAEFSLTTPLKVNNLAVAQSDGAVVSLILGFKNGKMQAPLHSPFTLEHLPQGNLVATLTCMPIRPDLTDSLKQQNIVPNPAWQYAECVLTLKAVNAQNQKIAMPSQLTEQVLPQGLSPFFITAHTPTSSVAQSNASDIAVYYLKK